MFFHRCINFRPAQTCFFECAKQGEFCGNSQRLSVRNIVRKLEFGKNNADIGCKIEGGGRRTEHCPLFAERLERAAQQIFRRIFAADGGSEQRKKSAVKAQQRTGCRSVPRPETAA